MSGECPPNVDLFRAAKALGVAPWELRTKPVYYKTMALLLLECDVLRETSPLQG